MPYLACRFGLFRFILAGENKGSLHIKGPVAETCPRVEGNVAGPFSGTKSEHAHTIKWIRDLAGHVPFVWSDTFSSCNTSCFRIIRIRIIYWYTEIWRTIRRTLQIIHDKKSTVCLRPQITKADHGGRSYTQSVVYSVLYLISFCVDMFWFCPWYMSQRFVSSSVLTLNCLALILSRRERNRNAYICLR